MGNGRSNYEDSLMTLIKESMKFGCNRCGLDLSYDEPKLGMKYSNVTYPEDIHLCSYCAQDVIDFANGKHGNIQTFKSAIAAARESREFENKHPIYPTITGALKRRPASNQYGHKDAKTGKWIKNK